MASAQFSDLNSIHIPSDKAVIPDTWGLQIRENQTFLHSPPGVMCRLNTSTDIATGTVTAVPFTDADDYDTDAFHNSVIDPQTVTIPAGLGGIYQVNAGIGFDNTNNGTNVFIELDLNGNATGQRQTVPGMNAATALAISSEMYLPDGSEVRVHAYQDSGSTRRLAFYPGMTWLSLRWVAPLQ